MTPHTNDVAASALLPRPPCRQNKVASLLHTNTTISLALFSGPRFVHGVTGSGCFLALLERGGIREGEVAAARPSGPVKASLGPSVAGAASVFQEQGGSG